MSFELLPNEILLDLFGYFDSTDLFFTFYGLNSRFNSLIYDQHQSYRFNFTSVSKRNLDRICQQNLPLIADRVTALYLSDFIHTANQINLFFSYMSSLKQFTDLQFLSISNVQSYQTLTKVINECHYLCNLTHFKLHSTWLQNDPGYFQLIVKNIWNLPKLIYCDFHINISGQQLFCMPTEISPSLQCLSIKGSEFKWNQINRLFEYTPRLTHLSINIANYDHDHYSLVCFPTLKDLKTYVNDESEIPKLFVFLQNTPNLRRLDITLFVLMDGYQWEELIRNHLPKLKVFRFQMREMLHFDENIQERIDELIDSFRGSFWIDEHRWFVQCYVQWKTIYLFTLSKTINYAFNTSFNAIESTCPYNNDKDELHKNEIDITDEIFFNKPIPSYIQLRNITTLSIKLPVDNQFWSRVPSLNRLRLLTIYSHVDTFQSQLQALFDRAFLIDKLILKQDKSLPLQRSLFKYKNISIRHLYLQHDHPCFNEEECMALAHSSLGAHCEILSIRVSNCESIIYLVQNMNKLRSLDVEYDDDVYWKNISLSRNNRKTRDISTSNEDELVQWLKDRLPLTCSIEKYSSFSRNVVIWI